MFAALWTLPILAALYVVWKQTVAFPFWDEWYTPGAQLASWYRGTLTVAELCSQHNESRKLVPRLIYLPLFTIAGWDVRLILPLVLGVVGLVSVGLYQLARRTIRPVIASSLAFTAMNFLLFSPREYQNFTNGIQWELYFPSLALLLALLANLSGRSLAWKTICNALLALVSTYTFANGMLLWLLAFPIATDTGRSSRSKIVWRVGYVAAATVSIALYFVSYRHPPFSPPAASVITNGPALLRFFLIWFGSLFRVANPVLAGSLVVTSFLALAAIAGWLLAKRGRWQSHYPWLVLGAYSLISGAITAVARLGFGFDMAADNRYTAFTVMLYVAVTGLAFTVYEQLRGNAYMRRGNALLGVGAALVLLSLSASTFNAEWRFLKKSAAYRKHLLMVFRWADAIPQNPELAWLTPYQDTPQVIHVLAEHDVLRPRPVSKAVAQAIYAVPNAASAEAGVLEAATPDGNGRFWVKGWAHVPDENRPADCVVVGWQTTAGWEPRWVVELTQPSSNSVSGAAFSWPLIAGVPPSGATLRAWAIDLQRDRVYALAGAINLAP
ncbi:MAG: hypothetical protein ABR611_07190 [Chthoniobacterales bacterium]